MKLPKVHYLNLKMIHESPGQSVGHDQLVDETGQPHPNPEQIIAELEQLDCIEREWKDGRYYLTDLGYELIEKAHIEDEETEEAIEFTPESLSAAINTFGFKKYKMIIGISLFIFGAFIAFDQFYNGPPKPDIDLTQEQLHMLKKDIVQQIDSIQNIVEKDSAAAQKIRKDAQGELLEELQEP